MGTRHLIGFRFPLEDGTIVVKGSYNQYDGYLTGVGIDLQKELPEIVAMPDLLDRVRKMRWVTASEKPTAEDLKEVIELGTWDHGVSTGEDWYSCLRKDHGSMLKRLQHGVATDDDSFLKDSLYCEYAYILDLTTNTPKMVILRGFNTDFANQWDGYRVEKDPDFKPRYEGNRQYAACALWWAGTVDEYCALDMEEQEKLMSEQENEDA